MVKNKFTNLILIIILIALFSFRIWQTTGCKQYTSFSLNPIDIKIAVESQVLEDKNLPRPISRFFHNKISTGIFEVTKSYAATLDTRFLISVLGPLGVLTAIVAILNIVRSRKLHDRLWLVPFLFSLILISSASPKISFYIIAISWYLLSIQGISFFAKSNLLKIIFILLVLITFWYFTFNWQMPAICYEIFFN